MYPRTRSSSVETLRSDMRGAGARSRLLRPAAALRAAGPCPTIPFDVLLLVLLRYLCICLSPP